MWDLIDVAKRTEVNALVIDVKDDRGFVLYRSTVPLAREIGADTTRPMSYRRVRAVLDSMRTYGIYPIARIVVAKDPLLAEKKLEWSIKRRSDSAKPWLDKNGRPWLDPHQRGVWQYAADLAKEAVNLGFSEVQFDYVRFPDEKRLVSEATFPLANGRIRAQVIREQLGFTRGELRSTGVPMTIDVFGLTATDTTDMDSVLIFTRTKHGADRVVRHLDRAEITATAMHADKSQAQRTQALDGFKRGTIRVLVATDIAQRGLDISGITHVINYDVPQQPEDYVHRIGRTGRAAATGDAYTFMAPDEIAMVRTIERVIGQQIPRISVPGFDFGTVAAD